MQNSTHEISRPRYQDYKSITITDKEFNLFRDLIYRKSGIVLKDTKKTLLVNRLNKRLKSCGFDNFKDYYNYLLTAEGLKKEFSNMIDCVTTNKTDFFRNQRHFDQLASLVIPDIVARKSNNRKLRIWSAGCSSGQEPYSLAIALHMILRDINSWDIKILATDISSRMLACAQAGVYNRELVEDINRDILKRHFLKGPGKVKIKDHIKKMIEFRYLNFTEPFSSIQDKFDLIFCRNVIIYFDRETQCALMAKFYKKLHDGGYLFLGHSESLHTINDQFQFVCASIYKK